MIKEQADLVRFQPRDRANRDLVVEKGRCPGRGAVRCFEVADRHAYLFQNLPGISCEAHNTFDWRRATLAIHCEQIDTDDRPNQGKWQ